MNRGLFRLRENGNCEHRGASSRIETCVAEALERLAFRSIRTFPLTPFLLSLRAMALSRPRINSLPLALTLAAGLTACGQAPPERVLANDTENSRLAEIDLDSGSVSPFAPHGIPGNVVGLAYQEASGLLYGISNGSNPALNGIYIFDTEDGSAQLAPITSQNAHPINVVSALVADPDSNTLYALQTGSPTRSALWEIDLDTNTFTQLANDLDPFMTALAYAPDGRLLAGSANFFTDLGTLYEVDTATATASALFTSAELRMTGLAVDPISGEVLGVFNGFGSASSVFEIDLQTGATTPVIGGLAGSYGALTTVPGPLEGDVNGDGALNLLDVRSMLVHWGPCGPDPCPADLNDDGMVDTTDLRILVSLLV